MDSKEGDRYSSRVEAKASKEEGKENGLGESQRRSQKLSVDRYC